MSALNSIAHVEYYVWLIAGFVLCVAETLVPGAFLIWIGAAALIVGAADFLRPLELTEQLLLFALCAAAFVVVGRQVYGSLERAAPPPALSRAHALVGKEFYLDSAIERGFGSIRVDDSVWRVAGADLTAGSKVRVVGVDEGSLLRVEKA
ncbi:MAG TPA: NfeD family protein [Roseiarcus sp.]|nr:NfeD family protein [Roseiarcus sp.]